MFAIVAGHFENFAHFKVAVLHENVFVYGQIPAGNGSFDQSFRLQIGVVAGKEMGGAHHFGAGQIVDGHVRI